MLNVPDSILERTIADLQSVLPDEGAGLWSGTGQDVLHWRPLQNMAADPRRSYLVHPQEWLDALADARALELAPLALVHSHPTADAIPSARDLQEWMYPQLWCVIVSFQHQTPVWQAYQIKRAAP